jgi:assimilatory nitrate reductase catalytic subunit
VVRRGGRGASPLPGLNQSTSGTLKNAALINLHLATGQIGRSGAGPFSLTGQPNAMGGREVGGLANLLPGHREAADPGHRAEIAALWGIDALPEVPGKTAVEMFEAVRSGRIKAVWIACTNPAQSLPDQHAVRAALERAELVVVQDAYAGIETARYADVVLPAASWGEKDGTVTNSERRISRVRAAVPPPGAARADWEIAADFGRRLARRLRPGQRDLFAFASVEDAWNEHRAATRGRDLDITGPYAILDGGPQQWRCLRARRPPRAGCTGWRIPHRNRQSALLAWGYRPPAERVDARYRSDSTGLRDQWHGMIALARSPRRSATRPSRQSTCMPRSRAPRPEARRPCHRRVAARRVIVRPRRRRRRDGQAFLAMHWGDRFSAARRAAALTRSPSRHSTRLEAAS